MTYCLAWPSMGTLSKIWKKRYTQRRWRSFPIDTEVPFWCLLLFHACTVVLCSCSPRNSSLIFSVRLIHRKYTIEDLKLYTASVWKLSNARVIADVLQREGSRQNPLESSSDCKNIPRCESWSLNFERVPINYTWQWEWNREAETVQITWSIIRVDEASWKVPREW
jgi:hypothetical protein